MGRRAGLKRSGEGRADAARAQSADAVAAARLTRRDTFARGVDARRAKFARCGAGAGRNLRGAARCGPTLHLFTSLVPGREPLPWRPSPSAPAHPSRCPASAPRAARDPAVVASAHAPRPAFSAGKSGRRSVTRAAAAVPTHARARAVRRTARGACRSAVRCTSRGRCRYGLRPWSQCPADSQELGTPSQSLRASSDAGDAAPRPTHATSGSPRWPGSCFGRGLTLPHATPGRAGLRRHRGARAQVILQYRG